MKMHYVVASTGLLLSLVTAILVCRLKLPR